MKKILWTVGTPEDMNSSVEFNVTLNSSVEFNATLNASVVFNTTLNSSVECNATLNSSDYIIPYDVRPETYVVPVVFLLIFLIGVIGNGTLVMIFIRHKHMRNVPNTYIFSLALADLLVIVTSVPFTSIIYTMENWPWGETICKISESAKDLSVAVSVFTLTALSADRFFAVVDPFKKIHAGGRNCCTTRITIIIAVMIWVASCLIALPAAMGSHIKFIPDEENERFHVCYPYPESWLKERYPEFMTAFKFLVLYLIPLLIIGFFYLNMAMHLISSTKNMPGEVQGLRKQMRARRKVAVTVLIFVAVFFVCFAPGHIFMLMFYFYPDFKNLYDAFWNYFRIMGFCLAYVNYCANPIALYFLSGAFRKYFNQYLFCRRLKRSRSDTYPRQQTSISLLSFKRHRQSSTKNDEKIMPNLVQ